MRLVGQVHVTLRGTPLQREPKFWEKIKRGFGASLDLTTDRMRVAFEAGALVDSIKQALVRLGFDNAVSLVIDDTVVFQDLEGRPGDLPDLMLAMSEHVSVFGNGFRELKLAVEHHEAGLHLLVETRAFTEHSATEPSAFVSVGGRVLALEPTRGETAEQYQARVTPLTADTSRLEAARVQFESFVSRLEGALRAALPEAIVEQKRADAVVVRPSNRPERQPASSPTSPAYDPYLAYYPSPMGMMLDVMMISTFMHMLHPPMIHVVHPSGAPIGSAEQVAQDPSLASAEDPSSDRPDDDDMQGGADEGDADDGGFDDGSDFDGGDFDGFD